MYIIHVIRSPKRPSQAKEYSSPLPPPQPLDNTTKVKLLISSVFNKFPCYIVEVAFTASYTLYLCSYIQTSGMIFIFKQNFTSRFVT